MGDIVSVKFLGIKGRYKAKIVGFDDAKSSYIIERLDGFPDKNLYRTTNLILKSSETLVTFFFVVVMFPFSKYCKVHSPISGLKKIDILGFTEDRL